MSSISRLIVIRGNSGSGKSTVANKLRLAMGNATMLIPQDVVRREILKAKDVAGNPSIQLIEEMALYGKRIGYDVIIEGIMSSERYGEMLKRLYSQFDKSYAFYFDVNFEETVRRHQTKSNSHEFDEKAMKEWWITNDFLDFENEVKIASSLSEEETVRLILDVISG